MFCISWITVLWPPTTQTFYSGLGIRSFTLVALFKRATGANRFSHTFKKSDAIVVFFLQNKSDSIHSFQKSERAICYFLSKTSNSHEKTKERIPNPAFISIVHKKKKLLHCSQSLYTWRSFYGTHCTVLLTWYNSGWSSTTAGTLRLVF